MTTFLLNLLQASIAGSVLYILALVIDKVTKRFLTPAERYLLYLPALFRFLCVFTIPIQIEKVIYGGPPTVIRTFLPDIFLSERTHLLVVCCLFFVVAVLGVKTGWEYRKCLQLIKKSSTEENQLVKNCSVIQMPLTCGFIRPNIYMPTHLCGEERNYALKHEKAHLARHDLVVRLAASITTMIHWFNPLAKGLQAKLEQTSELACDADTIQNLSRHERGRYGHMLLNMFSEQQPLPCLHGLPKERENITERIESITRPMIERKKRWISYCSLIFLLIIMVVSLIRIEAFPISAGNLESNNAQREMMDWLVETVQEYEIPFEPDATTLQNLPDLLMREAENYNMAHRFVLMYRSVELQPVFQEVLKSGDTSLRGQLACAGLNDYLNWYLIDNAPISQGMAEELFELLREWRKLQ